MNLQDFLHGIGARFFFGPRVCREYLKIYVKQFHKKLVDMDSLGKYTQIQKKIDRTRVHEGEITNLNLAL